MNDETEDNDAQCSATDLAQEIGHYMNLADGKNAYGRLGEGLMGDNWQFICSRLVLSDDLENAPVGLSPRLEIASRMMPRLDENWMPEPAAKRALIFADALLAADAPPKAEQTTEPGITITREQADALAAWAEENHSLGNTAWGPKFNAAMVVAEAVRADLDDRDELTDRVAFGAPCNHEECAGHGACLRQTK